MFWVLFFKKWCLEVAGDFTSWFRVLGPRTVNTELILMTLFCHKWGLPSHENTHFKVKSWGLERWFRVLTAFQRTWVRFPPTSDGTQHPATPVSGIWLLPTSTSSCMQVVHTSPQTHTHTCAWKSMYLLKSYILGLNFYIMNQEKISNRKHSSLRWLHV